MVGHERPALHIPLSDWFHAQAHEEDPSCRPQASLDAVARNGMTPNPETNTDARDDDVPCVQASFGSGDVSRNPASPVFPQVADGSNAEDPVHSPRRM